MFNLCFTVIWMLAKTCCKAQGICYIVTKPNLILHSVLLSQMTD